MSKTTVKCVVELDIKYDENTTSEKDVKRFTNAVLTDKLSDSDLKDVLHLNSLTLKCISVNLKKTVKKIVDWG